MRKTSTMRIHRKLTRAAAVVLASTAMLGMSGTVHAQFPAPYCAFTLDSDWEPITLVNFAGINQTSGNTVVTGATTPNQALTNYTSVTGTVAQGLTYATLMKGNTNGAYTTYFTVFIDWNQNGNFSDIGELYQVGSVNSSTGLDAVQASGSITVPATAALGNTRMRVVKRFSAATLTACDANYGAAQDYTITVVIPPCTPPAVTYTTVPNCATGQFSTNVAISSMGTADSIAIKEGTTTLAMATAAGNYVVGPFASGSSHTLLLENSGNALCNLTSPAQIYYCPPANDEAINAIALSVNPDYNCGLNTAGLTTGATASVAAAPTCSATGIDDDVWYSFVATATAHRISFSGVTTGTMVAALYTGTPASLSFMTGACASTTLNATGLTPGVTYYVRAYSTSATVATAGFNICVGTAPPPPLNDEATGAMPLTVNADFNCGITTAGTTLSATTSAAAAATCSPTGINDDVWYSFVATAANHRISFSNVTTGTMVAALYTGTPASLTFVTGACASTTLNATALTAGTTYYVRAYTSSATTTTMTGFNVCVGTPPPPPANDNCAGAIAFPLIPSSGTCASVIANTQSATQSLTGCTGTADDDVWYSFVCPTGYSSLMFENTSISGSTDRVVEFFSGSCGSLTSILCSDAESNMLTGLVSGQTYYLRVHTYGSGDNTNVSVCLKTPPEMTYVSSNTTHPVTASFVAGNNIQIIRTVVVTTGLNNPLNLTQLNYNTAGTGNPATSLTNAKVYYTGTSTTFSTATPFGSAVANPNGAFSVTGSQVLTGSATGNTNNYFWLAYDVNCSATATDSIDAECSSMTVGGATSIPTTTAPAGNRKISSQYLTTRTDINGTAVVNAGAFNAPFVYANIAGSAVCPATTTAVEFAVSGTAPAADIAMAKCYYTTSSAFSNAQPFGTAIANPATSNITFTGSQALASGSNYFWLVYDLSCNATAGNSLNGNVNTVVVNGVTIPVSGSAPSANNIGTQLSTTQPSTSSVAAGTLNSQVLRVALSPCGASSTLSSATFDLGTTTAPADILTAKVYYTTSTSFSTAIPFGTAVANPAGSFTVNGSQAITAPAYLWLVYDLNCAATAANVIDGACSSLTLSGTPLTPVTSNPTGTRAITAATTTYTATSSQPSTASVLSGATDQAVLRVALTGCPSNQVTGITFNTSGSTSVADIAGAKVYFTTTTIFDINTPFGTPVSNPNGDFTVTGSQQLMGTTGYFWLVYDIAGSATAGNVVDASCISALIAGNTAVPATANPVGTRAIVAAAVNDMPAGAITLSPGTTCATAYTNTNSALSTGEPRISCKGSQTAGTQVWFKFVSPASGFVKVSTDYASTALDTKIGLFSATNPADLSTFSILSCDDDGGVLSSTTSSLYASGLTPGATYYVAVAYYDGSNTGAFCIDVTEMTSAMLATTGTCTTVQGLSGMLPAYHGWYSLMDAGGKLVAEVKQTAGTATDFSGALTVVSGPSRTDATGQAYLNRNFLVNGTGATSANLKLYFTDAEVVAFGTPLNTLSASRVPGSTCSPDFIGTADILTQNASSSANGISWIEVTTPGFSNFFIAGNVPLTTRLKNFSGKNAGTVNNLNWETGNEENFSHFELERSADGSHFSSLTQIEADRKSTGSSYAYTDAAPFEGLNIYRLKMVDLANRFTYSEVVTLTVKGGKGLTIQVYPNPVTQVLNILVAGKTQGQGRIQVVDITGKTVATHLMQGTTARIDMSRLPAGMYLVKYADNNNSSIVKVTKE